MLLANFCFFTLLRTNRPQELMKVAPSSRSKQILNELFQKIVQMHSKELNAHLGLNTCSTDKVRMEPANSQVIELCCNIFNVFICFSFLLNEERSKWNSMVQFDIRNRRSDHNIKYLIVGRFF